MPQKVEDPGAQPSTNRSDATPYLPWREAQVCFLRRYPFLDAISLETSLVARDFLVGRHVVHRGFMPPVACFAVLLTPLRGFSGR